MADRWPAWSVASKARCRQHGQEGCPDCNPPLDLNDYLPELSVEQAADAAQDAYEQRLLGWRD